MKTVQTLDFARSTDVVAETTILILENRKNDNWGHPKHKCRLSIDCLGFST